MNQNTPTEPLPTIDAGGGLGPAGRNILTRPTGKHAGPREPLTKGMAALLGLDKKKEATK